MYIYNITIFKDGDNMYDVIVIGGGPAGLFTAINTSIKNNRVLLLEKKASAGRKLLISGAGQCNITHEGDIKDFLEHYGDNNRFLRNALYNFDSERLKNFFNKRGIHFITDEKGKVFPRSLKAMDILNVLLNECKFRNVIMKYNSRVTNITKEDECFVVNCENKTYKSKIIIIATGGNSYPNTGSAGDGYVFGEKLGHTITDISPALTSVYVQNYLFKDLAGVSFTDIPVSLWRNNKKLKNWKGDLLLTHKNISGPAIINYSRYIRKNDVLKFNFVNADNEEDFRVQLKNSINKNGQLMLKTVLKKFDLPKRFLDKILEISNSSSELKCAELNKKLRNNLMNNLLSYPMIVQKLEGFNLAMATSGGVCLKEVNSKTMESKIVEGLYFVGEVLDIDGDTGGYNIQAAFSMGKLAAEHIVSKLD